MDNLQGYVVKLFKNGNLEGRISTNSPQGFSVDVNAMKSNNPDWYKAAAIDAYIEALQQELYAYREQSTTLSERCEELEKEREWLAKEILTALSGVVCTPAEGYIIAGMHWIIHDTKELVKLVRG
jgi:hypothetical protein